MGASILVDRHEAAALLAVTPRIVSDLVRRREIPFLRVSHRCLRFRRAALLQWAAARETKAI